MWEKGRTLLVAHTPLPRHCKPTTLPTYCIGLHSTTTAGTAAYYHPAVYRRLPSHVHRRFKHRASSTSLFARTYRRTWSRRLRPHPHLRPLQSPRADRPYFPEYHTARRTPTTWCNKTIPSHIFLPRLPQRPSPLSSFFTSSFQSQSIQFTPLYIFSRPSKTFGFVAPQSRSSQV